MVEGQRCRRVGPLKCSQGGLRKGGVVSWAGRVAVTLRPGCYPERCPGRSVRRRGPGSRKDGVADAGRTSTCVSPALSFSASLVAGLVARLLATCVPASILAPGSRCRQSPLRFQHVAVTIIIRPDVPSRQYLFPHIHPREISTIYTTDHRDISTAAGPPHLELLPGPADRATLRQQFRELARVGSAYVSAVAHHKQLAQRPRAKGRVAHP